MDIRSWVNGMEDAARVAEELGCKWAEMTVEDDPVIIDGIKAGIMSLAAQRIAIAIRLKMRQEERRLRSLNDLDYNGGM